MTYEMFTALDGVYHSYRRASENAPTLVFANSLGTDLRVWDRVINQLPEQWGILRHDKRGHGLSTACEEMSIETLADDVEVLLDHYGISSFVGIGLSVGGLIMQRLALRRDTAMSHLVLADTAAKIGTPEMWNQRINTVRSEGISSIKTAILSRWFAPTYQKTQDFTMWEAMLERTPDEGYAQVCVAIRDADYRADLGQITQPTLVIVGAEDSSTPPELVEEMAHNLPSSVFHKINHAGHLPCVEQPAAFVDLLHQHLAT
ncbi:3-oxoadipate enol-lactonase [Celeribacter sp.]|uniref:3-oxoadipate enol-lactonase n=1 Tax=Celeribacter sp. TaxID=1890673 RepID=UPI003A9529F6